MVEKTRGERRPEEWLMENAEGFRDDEALAEEVRFLRRALPRRSERERGAWGRLGVLVLAALAGLGSAEKLEGLERALGEADEDLEGRIPDDPERMPDDVLLRLEAENALRVLARYRRLEERSIPARELRERLGVSREQMSRLREQGRLLGVLLPFRQSYHYPAWQFDPRTGEALEGLPELVRVAREEVGMGPVGFDAFMTSRKKGEGALPYELLKGGPEGRERVLEVLRASRDVGS
jgi:hypothetical protein